MRGGAALLVLSDRGVDRDARAGARAARPRRRCNAAPRGGRSASGLRAHRRDRRGPRGHHVAHAHRLRRRRGAIPGSRSETLARAWSPTGRSKASPRDEARRGLSQGPREGRAQGDVQDGHLDGAVVPRRADVRSAGARRRVRGALLSGHRVAPRRPSASPRCCRRGRGAAPSASRAAASSLDVVAGEALDRRRALPVPPRRRAARVEPEHHRAPSTRGAVGRLRALRSLRAHARTTRRATEARSSAACSTSSRAMPCRSTRSSRPPRSCKRFKTGAMSFGSISP